MTHFHRLTPQNDINTVTVFTLWKHCCVCLVEQPDATTANSRSLELFIWPVKERGVYWKWFKSSFLFLFWEKALSVALLCRLNVVFIFLFVLHFKRFRSRNTEIWTPNTPMVNKDVRQGQKSTLFTWQDSRDGLSRTYLWKSSRYMRNRVWSKTQMHEIQIWWDFNEIWKMFPTLDTVVNPRYFRNVHAERVYMLSVYAC